MSPIGGVGINLAVQDAVAAANILAPKLVDLDLSSDALSSLLQQVQDRRGFPTRVIQAVQVAAQNNLIGPLLESTAPPRMPFALRLFRRFPALRALPAYVIGIGVRPEHVRSVQAANIRQ
jgi:2-polyprenyl-6-methoxyphenol hydroxylase-like FAD-dependent oxidoreductase